VAFSLLLLGDDWYNLMVWTDAGLPIGWPYILFLLALALRQLLGWGSFFYSLFSAAAIVAAWILDHMISFIPCESGCPSLGTVVFLVVV